MLGIIYGTSLTGEQFNGTRETVHTKYGTVEVFKGRDAIFLPRHGVAMDTPPHRINHLANISALKMSGASGVVCISSTGSLKQEIAPGTMVVVHDYINFGRHVTFYDEEIRHVVPGFDYELRDRVIRASRGFARGVYVQTHGPRFETKAEIAMLRQHADVVGMTLANEATLCSEGGIPVAALCTVDNYANGVSEQELDYETVIENVNKNRDMVVDTIARLIG